MQQDIRATKTAKQKTGKNIILGVLMFLLVFLGSLSSPLAAEEGKKKSFGTASFMMRGLEGKIYELPKNTRKLPTDWSKVKQIGLIYTDHLNVPPQSWENGFPNVTDRFEWFAIVYTGRFHSKKAACYQFRLKSDDGSKLYIDNKLIIDNDGLHAPAVKTGKLCLDTKSHDIKVEYFQGPRVKIALQLFYHFGNKKEEQAFPGKNLVLDPKYPIKALALGFSCCFGLIFLLLLLLLWRRSSSKKKKQEESSEPKEDLDL